MEERARRHHLVPEFYLRRFADDQGRIRRVDMSGNNLVMSVTNAAVETDFYTITTGDGPSDAIERVSARLSPGRQTPSDGSMLG